MTQGGRQTRLGWLHRRSAAPALALTFGLLAPLTAIAQTLQPFSKSATAALPAPWRVAGLPKGQVPVTQIEVVTLGIERVLKLATDQSYGNALHEIKPVVLAPGSLLKWRWLLEKPASGADLRTKAADDAAVKVCALFDMPLEKLGFVERNLLRLARNSSGEKLPAATLCYVWDNRLAVGTELPNAYTQRLRYVVLDAGDKSLGQWVTHERDLARDLQKAFGHEFDTPPPLVAIMVGADTDNTKGSSVAYLGDILLSVKPTE